MPVIHESPPAIVAPPIRRSSSNSIAKYALVGLLVAGLGIAAISSQFTQGDGFGGLSSSGPGDQSYSYYHQQNYDENSYSTRWEKDGAFDRKNREWTYDGTYDYSGYGSKGMQQRASGKRSDPLYTQTDGLPDVFDETGAYDPTGGDPVGDAWMNYLDPDYHQYATSYSNPYANRIRLTFGPGQGRGEYLDSPGP